MAYNKSAESRLQYTNLKNQTKKVITRTMRDEVDQVLKKTEYKTRQYFQIGEVREKRWER